MKTVLTAAEVAKQLRVSVSQVSRLAARGKIPGAKDLGSGGINHKWRFAEELIDKWLLEETQRTRGSMNPPRQRRKATPVQRTINRVSQATERQDQNGNVHGTEYPTPE